MASNCVSNCMALTSAWLMRFAPLFARDAQVLDVACGQGRHAAYLALRGCRVTAVDIDVADIEAGLGGCPGVTIECRDLEKEPWPYEPERFDAVVVINYLWREHFPHYWSSLRPGGIFVMETFTKANAAIWGRPKNPAHFLHHRELLSLVPADARIIAYEEGLTVDDRAVERIVAAKPSDAEPYAWPLGVR